MRKHNFCVGYPGEINKVVYGNTATGKLGMYIKLFTLKQAEKEKKIHLRDCCVERCPHTRIFKLVEVK